MHAAEDKLFHSWVPGLVKSAILWGFRGCRRCLVLTQFWADYYSSRLSITPDNLLIMPNPADLPSEVPDRDAKNKLNILFLGRIGARKGVFDLVRAFAMLSEDVKQHCQLTLAGDGETQNAFRLAAVTGCTAQVTVTGWLDRSDVVKLLRVSDVLVLPSYAEGMAISVLEAMAWGLAVITTDSDGSTSFLQDRHNCLLVKPGDVAGIHDAIRNIYNDPDMRLHLGRAARITAEGLNIDRYVSTLSLVYRDAGEGALRRSGAARGAKPTLTHGLTK
jgi:glycosyltransferase involved in cell wall biosynthesis